MTCVGSNACEWEIAIKPGNELARGKFKLFSKLSVKYEKNVWDKLIRHQLNRK